MASMPDEYVRAFVIAAHSDLDTVRSVLAEHPELLNVNYEWGEDNYETPLGAASHVGNRAVADYLLDQGAPLTICAAAMLGRAEDVRRFLQEDPANANALGAHNIPLMLHVALGGSVEVAEMVASHGGDGEIPMRILLHVATARGEEGLVRWALERGVDANVRNNDGKTPLDVAEGAGHAGVVAMLRAHGGEASS